MSNDRVFGEISARLLTTFAASTPGVGFTETKLLAYERRARSVQRSGHVPGPNR
jgi:hypothetical protein